MENKDHCLLYIFFLKALVSVVTTPEEAYH